MDMIQKFQDLLKRLFQFDTSDLDFGIYRILNYKREQIEKFISQDLVDKIESAFAKHKDERLANIDQSFEKSKENAIKGLGTQAFTPTGDLKEHFKDTPLGEEYLTIKARKEEAETIDQIKLQVFNDLYSFFSRYYEEGDFVPQYRYSVKGHKYVIPYNGEEVKLYWANSDQYYTKTGLLFRDYTFRLDSYKVIFRTVSAKEELGSNKATKERFFTLDDEKPIEIDDNNLVIRFQYRELTNDEVASYGVAGGSNSSKQENINQKSYEEILSKIEDATLKVLLDKEHNEKSILLYHISRFTAKNSKDYFIHKDLKGFLSEQLDYFIKSEVLSIDTLEQERFLDKHITRGKSVRDIGEDIIDFLAQIEDFQKRLWEKKKFVLKTEYVITTDRVPKEFYEEILNNEDQKREWIELGFDIPDSENALKSKKLPIDTRYFDKGFKERLLERLTEKADLDDLLNGILIKSENWQALNLLLGKYKEKVQTIYIDPPFNLGNNPDFLYNVNYKDSSWVSILENRLQLAKNLMNGKGCIFVRCDYNGNMYVKLLMNEIFREENFRNEIIINRRKFQMIGGDTFSNRTETLWLYSKTANIKFNKMRRKIDNADWKQLLHLPGSRENPERYIEDTKVLPPNGRHFGISQASLDIVYKEGRIRFNEKGQAEIFVDSDEINNNWSDIDGYSFGWDFSTENSEILLKRVIESATNESDLVLDFFLGSGTTTAVAHKLRRKWIGVEMGDHFWTVALPRMKKVLAYDKSGISKENDVKEKYSEKSAGGVFKYQVLEQYEDTLDNIELKPNEQAELKFGDNYLLKYFLDYETRDDASFLSIEKLKTPFSYKLKVNLDEVGETQEMIVDIPETFNYLLGLNIKKIKAREKYLFIFGEKDGKDVAIVWRDYNDGWSEDNFRKDKEFIIQEVEPWTPQIVYVNGQSVLTPKLGNVTVEVRYIEPEFNRLME